MLGLGEGSEHGTFLAGLLAAGIGNSLGIDGMNDELLLYNSRVTGFGQWAEALLAYVNWLQEQGERNGIALIGADLVQQNPDGTVTTRFDLTPREREAIKAALDAGVMLVVPMGNEGGIASVLGQTSNEHGNVLSVIATNNDVVAPYSNRGWGGVLSAEGGSLDNPVRSLVGDGIGTMIGTSVAAGYMAGYASLVWAENPGLNYRQVMDILKQTATDLGPEGWDEETGHGKVDLKAALKLARETEGQPIEASNILIPSSWVGEGTVTPSERPASINNNDDRPSGALNLGTNPNTSVNGQLSWKVGSVDEVDYFRFSLDQQSPVTIRFNGTTGDQSGQIMILLESESGSTITSVFDANRDPVIEVSLEPGNYYIQVLGGASYADERSFGYSFSLSTVSNSGGSNPEVPDENSGGLPVGFSVNPDFYALYLDYSSQLGSATNLLIVQDGLRFQPFTGGIIVGIGREKYAIFGTIWDAYSQQGGLSGALGLPTSNPQTQNGVTWQTFENGTLFDIGGIALQLDSRIVEEYFEQGGPGGFLGVPKGTATVDANGFIRQPFENGYIVWNGVEAVAYTHNKKNNSDALTPEIGDVQGTFEIAFGGELDTVNSKSIVIPMPTGNYLVEGLLTSALEGKVKLSGEGAASVVYSPQEKEITEAKIKSEISGLNFKFDNLGKAWIEFEGSIADLSFNIQGNVFTGSIDAEGLFRFLNISLGENLQIEAAFKQLFDGRYHRQLEGEPWQKVKKFVEIVAMSGEDVDYAINVLYEKYPEVKPWVYGSIVVGGVAFVAGVAALLWPSGEEPAFIAAFGSMAAAISRFITILLRMGQLMPA